MKTKLNPAGWVRLVLYVVSALIGIATVICTTLGYTGLATILGAVAGAGAAITGGTAVVNLPKAPDHSPLGGLDLGALLPAIVATTQAINDAKTPAPATAPVEVPAGQTLFSLDEVNRLVQQFGGSINPAGQHREE